MYDSRCFGRRRMRPRQQPEPAALFRGSKRDLLVRRLDILHRRFDPDLQEMHRLGLRRVELAVYDSGAGRHRLDRVRPDDMPLAHAVLMREAAFEDVTDNLHVAMGVGAKTLPRSYTIVVDDPQSAESHVRGVVIVREGKGMPGIQPAVVGVAPVASVPDRDHLSFSL